MKLLEADKNIRFELCDSYESVIRDSDLVISAITKVTENFASDNCFKEGVTVIPVCTLGFQNCDLFFDKVFTDEIEQIRGFKYFSHFEPITTNVSDVLNGIRPGRPIIRTGSWCIITVSPSMTWFWPRISGKRRKTSR